MKCHWWNRWYHRRLRRIDAQVMLPIIRNLAPLRQPLDSDAADTAIATFKAAQGQEHWNCACAYEEGE